MPGLRPGTCASIQAAEGDERMTLTEFLRARLDEDERVATVLGDDMRQSWAIPEDESVAVIHMHRHAPARVLAEVDAKRRIMDEHTTVVLRGGPGARYYETTRACRSCEPPKQFPETAVPCRTLRLLALPYAGHPDYDPAWRP